VIEGEFAYVFGVGMVAAFNPCGFAMLPAYLAYFTEVDGEDADGQPVVEDSFRAVLRALKVGAAMTAGFVLVFTLAWLIIDRISSTFQDHLSWVTMGIGVALVVIGVAYLLGKEVRLPLPHLERGGDSRELRSMFLYGVSYALASLSCTIPTFMTAVAFTFKSESFLSGLAALIVYALGMGLVVTFLTVSLALAKHGIVHQMRRVLPYISRIAGGMLVAAGLYMIWYGWWEEQTLSGNETPEGPVGWVTELSSEVTTWVRETGPVRLGLLLAGLLGVVVVLAWGWRASRPRETVTG
jgi:cytochrome c-type biogenesis protein